MGAVIDITGKKYGHLTAVKFKEIRFGKGGKPKHYWLFQCDCGEEKVLAKADVMSGKTKSCRLNHGIFEDIKGKKFNHLTAIKYIGIKHTKSGNRFHYWLFRCDCGNEKVIKRDSVVYGVSKSCGCHFERTDIAGNKYNFLTAIRFSETRCTKKGKPYHYWLFKCDCGKEKVINKQSVVRGTIKSCGCQHSKLQSIAHKTHGETKTRLYKEWRRMMDRCNAKPSKNDCHYESYVLKGITVCDEWINSFETFRDWALSHGYADNLTIDRINYNGNYCPENCRWITNKEQQSNKSTNKFIEYNGERLTHTQWSERLGGGRCLVHHRLMMGWSEMAAVSTPRQIHRKQVI